MQRICLNMIVKNESAIIERCLEALAPHIDCYVICDTGSTDATVDIVRGFFNARGIPGDIVNTTFHNFEQARNEALDAARASAQQYDYLLFCDADMELRVDAPDFRRNLQAPVYNIVQRTANGLEYPNVRLLHRGLVARYRGVTHEYLDVGSHDRPVLDGVHYLDHAAGANRAGKFQRDIALLGQGLKEEPDNARYVFYTANSYYDLGDNDAAISWYKRRIGLGGWVEEQFYSSYRIGLCLQRLGRDAEAISQLLITFDRYPHRAEPLHVVALHYQRQTCHRLAYQFALLGTKLPPPQGALFVETDVYTWRLTDILAVSLYWLGRRLEGAELNRKLLGIVPEDQRQRVAANLAFCETPVATGAAGMAAKSDLPQLEKYVGLKQWGWYVDQLDLWKAHLSTSNPVKVLEIGAFDGISANLMLDLIFPHPESTVLAIDPYLLDPTTPEVSAGTQSQFESNLVAGGHGNQIKLAKGFSFDLLHGLERESYDFVYVDGSHLARHVLEDAVLAFRLVKPGGVLGFDDYEWGHGLDPAGKPKPAIDAFEAVYADQLELLFCTRQRFYRRRV